MLLIAEPLSLWCKESCCVNWKWKSNRANLWQRANIIPVYNTYRWCCNEPILSCLYLALYSAWFARGENRTKACAAGGSMVCYCKIFLVDNLLCLRDRVKLFNVLTLLCYTFARILDADKKIQHVQNVLTLGTRRILW